MTQYARLVETSHSPDVARGDYAIFVRMSDLNRPPRNGELVHCVRLREDLEEHSLRRVVLDGNRVELHIDGAHNHHRDPVIWTPSSRDVRIDGLHVGTYRPARLDL